MTRPLFASAGKRSAVECVVPWTDDARYSAALFETAFEMLAEVSLHFRVWLVPMAEAQRPFSSYDAAVEALGRLPQVRVWHQRGQIGLDRLNAMLDTASPGAIRVVADFDQSFRSADLAEALSAGKRRVAAFGLGIQAPARKLVQLPEGARSIRVDSPQTALFGRPAAVAEAETGARRLRSVSGIRKIRTSGVS